MYTYGSLSYAPGTNTTLYIAYIPVKVLKRAVVLTLWVSRALMRFTEDSKPFCLAVMITNIYHIRNGNGKKNID